MTIPLPASAPVWHSEHGYGLVNRLQSGIVYLDDGLDPQETSDSTGWVALGDDRPRTSTALVIPHPWNTSPAQRTMALREMLRIGRSKNWMPWIDEAWTFKRRRDDSD